MSGAGAQGRCLNPALRKAAAVCRGARAGCGPALFRGSALSIDAVRVVHGLSSCRHVSHSSGHDERWQLELQRVISTAVQGGKKVLVSSLG